MQSAIKRLGKKGLSILLAMLLILPTFTWLTPIGTFSVAAATVLDETNCHISSSGVITWYSGLDTTVEVPAEIGGITVTGIGDGVFMNKGLTAVSFSTTALVSIGDQAFQDNELVSIIIPDTVVSIGAQAFFNNKIDSLTLPAGLTSLGRYAFRNNNLTSVTLPASLNALPEGAFMQNPYLSSVNLEALTVIGNSAFSGCNFDTATLPADLTNYGENVFSNNRRYVLVSGSELAKTYSVPGQFGEIAGAMRTLTVKFQDMNGNQLLEDKTFTSDRAVQAPSTTDLIVDGNAVSVALPSVKGYVSVNGASKSIVIAGDMTYVARYRVDGDKPVILGLESITVDVGGTVNLRAGVTAMDYKGNDLTSSIEITPSAIDTSAPRGYSVKYVVRDADGRITTEYRDVLVGADPMKMEVGLGWLYEDFLYSADGTILQGLSATGIAKFNAGNTAVVLPGKCPKASNGGVNVPITSTLNSTSSAVRFPQNFTYISFDKMTSIVTIGNYAFGTQFTELDLSKCALLQTIGNSAFRNAKLTSLDLSNNIKLQTIGESAFYNAPLTSLDLSNNIKLQTIGEAAFYNAKLTSLNLSDNVSLQTIGNYAFQNVQLTSLDLSDNVSLQTIGNSAFQNAKLTSLDLSDNVSLQTIGNYAFQNVQLTSLDLSNNINLQNIGDFAFFEAQMTTLDLSGSIKLQSIGNSAFYNAPLTSLDLSKNINLQSIGYNAFYNAPLTSLDLSNNINLQTIGSSAFYNALLTSLDLSNNINLQTIGSSAFYNALLTSLDLSNNTNLQHIGYSAFCYSKLTSLDVSKNINLIYLAGFDRSPLTELDLSQNIRLQTIGNYAFSYSLITSLDLSKNINLQEIGGYAFSYSLLTSLDLSKNVNLKTIRGGAFYDIPLTSLDLSNNINLQTIEQSAFYNAKLTSLDLSNNINLQTIGSSAFYASPLTGVDLSGTKLTSMEYSTFHSIKNNAVVYLPDSVTALKTYSGTGVFGRGNEKTTWVYTNSSATTLTDQTYSAGTVYETHIFINKAGYAVDLRDEHGNKLYAGCSVSARPMSEIGNEITVTPPVLWGYDTPEAQALLLDNAAQTVTFVYARGGGWVENPKIQVSLSNPSNNRYRVSKDEAQIAMAFNVSTDFGTLPAGSEIVITLYDGTINLDTLRMGTTSAFINRWYIQNNELHLVLNEVIGGDTLVSFPILFKFVDDGSVPYNHEALFDAYIIRSNGDGTKEVVASSDPKKPAKAIGYFDKNSLNACVNDEIRYSRTIALDDDTDVHLGWAINYSSSSSARIRQYEFMEITYDIPTYLNNAGETVRALFIPENNPGWEVVATDADGNPTQVRLCSDYSTRIYDSGTNLALRVRFSDAKPNQQVPTSLNAILIPKNISETEQTMLNGDRAQRDSGLSAQYSNLFYLSATLGFYIAQTKTPLIGKIIRVDKDADPKAKNSATGKDYGDGHGEFYDNYNNTNREYAWTLKLSITSDYIGTNAVLHDYDLDPRMYYYGVAGLNGLLNEVEIVAYDAFDNELCRAIPIGDRYVFPADVQQQIKKVDIFFLGEYTQPQSVKLLTKLYDEDMTVVKALASGGVDFYNYSWGEFDAEHKEDGNIVHAEHNDPSWSFSYWKILHNAETMHATKSNSPTGVLFRGDYITYTVGVAGNKMSGSEWDGFALLDILPDCLEFVDVRMSNEFASIPGAKVEVIPNYNGSGLTGILFTADTFNCPSTGEGGGYSFRVGYIDTKIGHLFNAVNFTNNVFAKVNASNNVTLQNTVTAAESYNLNGNNSSSRAYVQNGYLTIQELSLRKYIRNVSGDNTAWTSSGIITEPGAEFEYKITLSNATAYALPDGKVYDVFPFVGDTYTEKITLGSESYVPRDSKFSNTFVSAVAPAGWTIYYTDATPSNTREFYNDSALWSTDQPANVTGIKFVADSGVMISAMSSRDFIIRMKAPEDVSLVGKRAYNSAAHKENETNNPNARELECNAVYNEIRQRGSVSLRKVDEVNAPLAGAVFQIIDSNGRIVQTKQSGANGMIVFEDLWIGNYTIKEVSPPEGYQPYSGTITISEQNMIVNNVYHWGDVQNQLLPPPPETGSVTLIKNSETGTVLRSVQFRVTGLDVGVNDHISQTKVTNTLGQVVFDNLPLGNYRIEELQTSSLGHLEAKYQDTFTLTTDGQKIDLGTILNDTASVTLVKIGIFSAEYQALENSELDAAMGAKLRGIAFELYDENNDLVASGVTNASGQLTFGGLELNKTYTIKEILSSTQADMYAPRGSGTGNNEYTFSVGLDGKLTFDGKAYDKQNLIIGNNVTDNEYRVLLRKVDQNGDPLKNVEFIIHAEGMVKSQSLYTDTNGEIVITKSELETIFGTGATGKFFITEVKAPLGYAKTFGPESVWVINWNNPDGYDGITVVNQEIFLNINKYSQVTSTVYETLQYLNLTDLLNMYNPTTTLSEVSLLDKLAVAKAAQTAGFTLDVNDENQWELRIPLAGAEITVTQVSNPSNTFSAVTDANGNLPIPDGFVIDEDEAYTVQETVAPYGYKLNNTLYTFKIANLKLTGGSGNVTYSDGNININIDNAPLTGSITVTKLDKRQGTVIPGVGFTLYNAKGIKVAEVYTDSNGVAVFSGLTFGDYVLKETDPMPGYDPDPSEYNVTVTDRESGQYHYITLRNETIIKYSKLTITKVNGNRDPLAGIEFYLMYSNDGGDTWDYYLDTYEAPYYFTNKEGKLVFDNLPAGTYKIVEITDDPQYGDPIYSPSDTFAVSDDEELDIQITVTNPNATGTLTITKAVEGDMAPNDTFSFTVTKNGVNLTTGTYMITGSNAPAGPQTIVNGAVALKAGQTATITGLDIGSDYRVVEADPGANYTTAYAVTGGTAKSDNGLDTGTIAVVKDTTTAVKFTNVFRNSYRDPTTLNLEGTKTLTTADNVAVPIVDGEFVFTLTPSASNPADGCVWSGKNPVGVSASGAINFGMLTFTKEGTYIFTIRETVPDSVPTGWVYDTKEVTVTVVVENDDSDQLKISSTTYSKGGEDVNGIHFVNKCDMTYGADSALIITKVDSTGTPLPGMKFYLMVSNDGGTTWVDYGTTHTDPAATNAYGKLIFRNLPAGMYKIVEITEDPAYGAPIYSPSDIFTIPENETRIIGVTVVNPLVTKTPHTGDDFQLEQWIMLCALGIIGMIAPSMFHKRKKRV